MNFIRPVEITDAMLISSTIGENDYAEWATGTTYAAGTNVIVTIPNVHKIYQSLVGSNVGNYPPTDVLATVPKWLEIGATNRWKAFDKIIASTLSYSLDEDCSDISTWQRDDVGAAVSEVSPAGQFRFDTNASLGAAVRSRMIAPPPNQFTVEITTYFDALGTRANSDYASIVYFSSSWRLQILFASEGLFVTKTGAVPVEVGADIVKCNGTAAWQTWQFQVDKSAGEASATVQVFLDNGAGFVSQGTFDCNYTLALPPSYQGRIEYRQNGGTTTNRVSHIDYIKVSEGLGAVVPTPMTYVLRPGLIDSIALLNLDATEVNITVTDPTDGVVYDETTDLITTINVTDWYTYFFSPIVRATDIVKTDLSTSALPPYPNATITITITNLGGTAKCGAIIVGQKFEIGKLEYGVSPGYTDYSTVTADIFGSITVVPRAYAKKLRGTLIVKNTVIDEVIRQLLLYKQTNLVWVGNEQNMTNPYSCLIVYGFCLSFDPVIQYPTNTIMSFEVQGLI